MLIPLTEISAWRSVRKPTDTRTITEKFKSKKGYETVSTDTFSRALRTGRAKPHVYKALKTFYAERV